MNGFVGVGRTADFTAGRGWMVTVGGRRVAMCLHRGGPLCEGQIESDVVTCPWHGWSYEIRTGTMVQDPRVGVSRHEVRIDGDEVTVRLAD
jgi:nitrite reductase/ring-hydroxylating ferredoxin subunit